MTSEIDAAGPSDRPSRTGSPPAHPQTLEWLLYALGIFVVAQVVPALVALVIAMAAGNANQAATTTEAQIIATPLIGAVLAFGSFWAVHRMGYGPSLLGWRWRGLHVEATNIGLGVVVALAMFAFEFVYDLVARSLGYNLQPLAPYEAALRSPVSAVFLVLTAVVAAPLGEELFWRGFLLGMLTRRRGTSLQRFAAVAGVALVWAVLHFNAAAIVQLTVFGIALGYLRTRQDSLVGSITAHALNNTVTVVVFLLSHYLRT